MSNIFSSPTRRTPSLTVTIQALHFSLLIAQLLVMSDGVMVHSLPFSTGPSLEDFNNPQAVLQSQMITATTTAPSTIDPYNAPGSPILLVENNADFRFTVEHRRQPLRRFIAYNSVLRSAIDYRNELNTGTMSLHLSENSTEVRTTSATPQQQVLAEQGSGTLINVSYCTLVSSLDIGLTDDLVASKTPIANPYYQFGNRSLPGNSLILFRHSSIHSLNFNLKSFGVGTIILIEQCNVTGARIGLWGAIEKRSMFIVRFNHFDLSKQAMDYRYTSNSGVIDLNSRVQGSVIVRNNSLVAFRRFRGGRYDPTSFVRANDKFAVFLKGSLLSLGQTMFPFYAKEDASFGAYTLYAVINGTLELFPEIPFAPETMQQPSASAGGGLSGFRFPETGRFVGSVDIRPPETWYNPLVQMYGGEDALLPRVQHLELGNLVGCNIDRISMVDVGFDNPPTAQHQRQHTSFEIADSRIGTLQMKLWRKDSLIEDPESNEADAAELTREVAYGYETLSLRISHSSIVHIVLMSIPFAVAPISTFTSTSSSGLEILNNTNLQHIDILQCSFVTHQSALLVMHNRFNISVPYGFHRIGVRGARFMDGSLGLFIQGNIIPSAASYIYKPTGVWFPFFFYTLCIEGDTSDRFWNDRGSTVFGRNSLVVVSDNICTPYVDLPDMDDWRRKPPNSLRISSHVRFRSGTTLLINRNDFSHVGHDDTYGLSYNIEANFNASKVVYIGLVPETKGAFVFRPTPPSSFDDFIMNPERGLNSTLLDSAIDVRNATRVSPLSFISWRTGELMVLTQNLTRMTVTNTTASCLRVEGLRSAPTPPPVISGLEIEGCSLGRLAVAHCSFDEEGSSSGAANIIRLQNIDFTSITLKSQVDRISFENITFSNHSSAASSNNSSTTAFVVASGISVENVQLIAPQRLQPKIRGYWTTIDPPPSAIHFANVVGAPLVVLNHTTLVMQDWFNGKDTPANHHPTNEQYGLWLDSSQFENFVLANNNWNCSTFCALVTSIVANPKDPPYPMRTIVPTNITGLLVIAQDNYTDSSTIQFPFAAHVASIGVNYSSVPSFPPLGGMSSGEPRVAVSCSAVQESMSFRPQDKLTKSADAASCDPAATAAYFPSTVQPLRNTHVTVITPTEIPGISPSSIVRARALPLQRTRTATTPPTEPPFTDQVNPTSNATTTTNNSSDGPSLHPSNSVPLQTHQVETSLETANSSSSLPVSTDGSIPQTTTSASSGNITTTSRAPPKAHMLYSRTVSNVIVGEHLSGRAATADNFADPTSSTLSVMVTATASASFLSGSVDSVSDIQTIAIFRSSSCFGGGSVHNEEARRQSTSRTVVPFYIGTEQNGGILALASVTATYVALHLMIVALMALLSSSSSSEDQKEGSGNGALLKTVPPPELHGQSIPTTTTSSPESSLGGATRPTALRRAMAKARFPSLTFTLFRLTVQGFALESMSLIAVGDASARLQAILILMLVLAFAASPLALIGFGAWTLEFIPFHPNALKRFPSLIRKSLLWGGFWRSTPTDVRKRFGSMFAGGRDRRGSLVLAIRFMKPVTVAAVTQLLRNCSVAWFLLVGVHALSFVLFLLFVPHRYGWVNVLSIMGDGVVVGALILFQLRQSDLADTILAVSAMLFLVRGVGSLVMKIYEKKVLKKRHLMEMAEEEEREQQRHGEEEAATLTAPLLLQPRQTGSGSNSEGNNNNNTRSGDGSSIPPTDDDPNNTMLLKDNTNNRSSSIRQHNSGGGRSIIATSTPQQQQSSNSYPNNKQHLVRNPLS